MEFILVTHDIIVGMAVAEKILLRDNSVES
jgi:hypothetical protein